VEFGKKINRFICFTNIAPKQRLLREIMARTGGHGEAEIKKCLRLEISGQIHVVNPALRREGLS